MGCRLGWEAMSKIETLSRQGSIEGLEGSDQIYVFKRLSGCFTGNRLKSEAHREHHNHPSEHIIVLGVGIDGRWAHTGQACYSTGGGRAGGHMPGERVTVQQGETGEVGTCQVSKRVTVQQERWAHAKFQDS